MLQQTTVNAVLPHFERWLKVFPSIRELARSPLRKVLKAWEGLGYYARARNLHSAAKLIVDRHGGRIPDEYELLRDLPGFGPYTTAAVLSVAYNKSYPVVDANVRRVFMRIFATRGSADGRHDRAFFDRLNQMIPRTGAGEFNQALMELGALLCRPRNPQCLPCPVRPHCRAFEAGIQEVIPRPKKATVQKIEAVVGVITHDDKVLIQKRPSRGLLAGLWELPGGKVERGEKPEAALAREIREELNARVRKTRFLAEADHSYTRYRVRLRAYRCLLWNEPRLKPGRQRWVRLRDLSAYPFPSGSVKIIRLLKKAGAAAGREKTRTDL